MKLIYNTDDIAQIVSRESFYLISRVSPISLIFPVSELLPDLPGFPLISRSPRSP